jgi:D-sedoheptulose 7-phosphate isomerase
MDLQQRVLRRFELSIRTQQDTSLTLSTVIVHASEVISACLLQGGKILSCGPGGSAGQSQHFATALLNRFDRERPGLPAICIGNDGQLLTAIANDSSYKEVYSKQIRALAQQADVLLLICAGSTSRSVLAAIKAGHDRDMVIVALTGDDGGEIADLLQSADVEIRVPAQDPSTIQETHLIIINTLCDLIDTQIFGEET